MTLRALFVGAKMETVPEMGVCVYGALHGFQI